MPYCPVLCVGYCTCTGACLSVFCLFVFAFLCILYSMGGQHCWPSGFLYYCWCFWNLNCHDCHVLESNKYRLLLTQVGCVFYERILRDVDYSSYRIRLVYVILINQYTFLSLHTCMLPASHSNKQVSIQFIIYWLLVVTSGYVSNSWASCLLYVCCLYVVLSMEWSARTAPSHTAQRVE